MEDLLWRGHLERHPGVLRFYNLHIKFNLNLPYYSYRGLNEKCNSTIKRYIVTKIQELQKADKISNAFFRLLLIVIEVEQCN